MGVNRASQCQTHPTHLGQVSIHGRNRGVDEDRVSRVLIPQQISISARQGLMKLPKNHGNSLLVIIG